MVERCLVITYFCITEYKINLYNQTTASSCVWWHTSSLSCLLTTPQEYTCCLKYSFKELTQKQHHDICIVSTTLFDNKFFLTIILGKKEYLMQTVVVYSLQRDRRVQIVLTILAYVLGCCNVNKKSHLNKNK